MRLDPVLRGLAVLVQIGTIVFLLGGLSAWNVAAQAGGGGILRSFGRLLKGKASTSYQRFEQPRAPVAYERPHEDFGHIWDHYSAGVHKKEPIEYPYIVQSLASLHEFETARAARAIQRLTALLDNFEGVFSHQKANLRKRQGSGDFKRAVEALIAPLEELKVPFELEDGHQIRMRSLLQDTRVRAALGQLPSNDRVGYAESYDSTIKQFGRYVKSMRRRLKGILGQDRAINEVLLQTPELQGHLQPLLGIEGSSSRA